MPFFNAIQSNSFVGFKKKSPISPAAPASGDPYYPYVTMLLAGNGTNGAQNNTFLDSSPNNLTITRVGNTTQGSFSPYGSNWSNYFNGSSYLSYPSNTAFALPSDFTLECWIYPENWNSTYMFILGLYSAGESSGGIMLGKNGSNFVLRAANVSDRLSYATFPTLNVWTHIVAVRRETTLSMYYNGVRVATATDSYSFAKSTPSVASEGAGSNFRGYISNLRLVKGTAIYDPTLSTLTVPTNPLTAVSGTSLLTCQSNRLIDTSSNAFLATITGTPSVQRFSPISPTAAYSTSTISGSGYFDGSGDYLSTPSTSNLFFGSGNFTIEAWVYANALGSYNAVFSQWPDNGGTTNNSYVLETVGSSMYFYWASGSTLYGPATLGTINVKEWTHYAICRSGNTLYPFKNGVLGATTSISETLNSPSSAVTVGGYVAGGGYWNGFISNLRVVKGDAVYTSSFTPPTSPVTAITNTQLLTNSTNGSIFDNAMVNDLETVGNAQISTSVVKYGTGSMYFDGTGDYLRSAPSLDNILGAGDFTIEFWLYPLTLSGGGGGYKALVSSENYSSQTGGWSFYQLNAGLVLWQSSGSIISAASSLTANTWQHVALCRASGTVRLFVNGTNLASTSNSTNFTGQEIWVGDHNSGDYFFDGYMDDLRITRGFARYTTTFTPPTAALFTL